MCSTWTPEAGEAPHDAILGPALCNVFISKQQEDAEETLMKFVGSELSMIQQWDLAPATANSVLGCANGEGIVLLYSALV